MFNAGITFNNVYIVYKFCSVRARAIGCFATCMSSQEASLSQIVRDIVTPRVSGAPHNPPRLIKTPGVHLQGKNSNF